ncbi:hypothetical protein GCM10025734_00820 [Kitasatospora paranensis]
MTHRIVWDEHAINAAARFLKDDHDGLRQVIDAVDLLADNPRPTGTAEYGSPACAACTSAATASCTRSPTTP